MRDSKRPLLSSCAALGLIAAACSGCTREDPHDLAYRAQTEAAAGRPAEAEAALARLARIRRLTVSERLLRSQAASNRGKIAEALAALDDAYAPTRGPEAALIAARRGELEMERHRFRAAEAELKRALVLNPKATDARRRLIWLYAQQGRSALVAAESVLLASGSNFGFLDLVVWTLDRHAPIDLAELADGLAQAVAQDPEDRFSRLALAETLRRLGRLDQADATLTALGPTECDGRVARARIALDRGDTAAAEALLGADAGDDSHAASAQLRGRLALGRGDAAAAVNHFRAALVAAPDDRDSHFGLSQALRLIGQAEAARPHAESARAHDHLEWLVQSALAPNRRHDLATLRSIARACRDLGRRDQAHAWYRLALRLSPTDSELKNAISQLDATSGQPATPD